MPSKLPIDGHSFRRVEVLTGSRDGDVGACGEGCDRPESQAPGAQSRSRCDTLLRNHSMVAAGVRTGWQCDRRGRRADPTLFRWGQMRF